MNKPNNADTAFFALPGQRLVALTGRDAVAFAQAQYMSDVAALGDRQWHWSGWLTPKGRLIALFALLRLDAETLWMLLPDADANDFATRLQRFVFRGKVAIALREDLKVSGAFAAPIDASGAQAAIDADGGVELDFSGAGGSRSLRITPAGAPAAPERELHWTREDLVHGLPRLTPAQVEQWTPQQLSLERLRAYSVRKGCYPGQEIVARTHFLGQAKRSLALLAAAAPLQDGAEVGDGARVLGTVVSSAGPVASGDRPLALAVLAQERGTGLRVGEQAVAEIPMLDGLVR